MVIEIQSTSDSKEAVTAAMADLAVKQEEKPVDPPKEEEPKEEPKEDEVKEPVESDGESEEPSDEEEKEEEENAELASKDVVEKPKKKGGFQKKIDKLRAEVELWRGEALRAKAPPPPQQEQPKVDPIPDFSKKPKADDFKTAEEYEEAVFDWKYEQRRSKEAVAEQQSRVKNEYQTKLVKHGERVEEFKKSYDDFEDHWNDALKEVGEANLSLTVREVILDSDVGPGLMKALADDPKEFRRICQLTPLKAAKELGKIEDRITSKKIASPAKEKTKTSKVPAPVKTVRAKGAAPVGYRDDMSLREYDEWRKQSSKRA